MCITLVWRLHLLSIYTEEESLDLRVVLFLLSLRNLHSGCTDLHSHQQYGKAWSLHLCSICYRFASEDGHSYWAEMISHLNCTSLTSSEIEHLFMYWLAICLHLSDICLLLIELFTFNWIACLFSAHLLYVIIYCEYQSL